MGPPYAQDAGNGLHVHFSVTNHRAGQNLFDNATAEGSELLLHAVAGCPHSFLIQLDRACIFGRY